MKISSRLVRGLSLAGLVAASATAVTGCYVVPLQPPPAHSPVHPAVAALAPVTFSARLYPANDVAAVHGTVMAVVTNELNGRGRFTTSISGENFAGEATRVAGSSRDGLANGAGNHGSYINCRYTMNSATLGTGSCRLSNGAVFTMHVGS